MRNRSRLPLTISATIGVALLLGACAAPAAPADASGAPADSTTAGVDAEVRTALDALIDAGATAAVVDVRQGDSTSSAAAGVRGVDDDTPAEVDDPLRIASITKSVTATVILQLAEEGELGLETTVDEILPGLLDSPAPVTVRQLLSHTSGLPEYLDVLVPDATAMRAQQQTEYTPEELLAAAQSRPWVSAPGSAFSYSNGNYVVLGLLAEEVTGTPLPELMEERILEPLGMDGTVYPDDSELPADALRGDLEIDGERVDVSDSSPTLWSSGAALVSTAGDVSTFFRALLGGELLEPETLVEMQAIGVEGYGLGLLAGGDACGVQPPELVYGQRGNGFGYRVMAFGSPDGSRFTTIAWTGGSFDPAADPLVAPGSELLIAALASTCP